MYLYLDVKYMETKNLIGELIFLLSRFLMLGEVTKSKSVQVGRFLSAIERRRADDLILFIRDLIAQSRKAPFKINQIFKMPLSRIARKLGIENAPKKIVLVVDSIEKIKFFLSKTLAQNWKFAVESELKRLLKFGRKLREFGLDMQFVFVSSVHLDLHVPSFMMQFMSEAFLGVKVDGRRE